MKFPYRWRATLVIALGLLMAVLDSTIVSVVLPQIATAFQTSMGTITWVATGYLLANAAAASSARSWPSFLVATARWKSTCYHRRLTPMVERERGSPFIEQGHVNYCKARKDTEDMSHEMTHRHTADQDDSHNHKHTGTSAFLNRSDRFFAPLDRQIVAWLQPTPGSRVLDAGCGGGGLTRFLAQAVGPGGEVVGLDANPQLIEWNRSQGKETDGAGQIHFQEGDVLHLPFEDGTFDLVWCSRVIHGLSDQVAGVRELARVVRPGGRVVLREGGLLPRFLPFDVGLGDPGLEERLAAAHARRFANWRASLPNGVAYPYGWSHILREIGLRSVMPRSFLHEFASPFEASQKDYVESWLSGYLHHPEHEQWLSSRDISTLEQLLDPASSQYVFARDDLHGIVVETIYVGSLSEGNHV